jgi:hypothetical protein
MSECTDTFEEAVAALADEAARAHALCLSAARSHVAAAIEVARARAADRGEDATTAAAGVVEALRRDIGAVLDRLAAEPWS